MDDRASLEEARKELADAEAARIDAVIGHLFLLICVLSFDWDGVTLMSVFLFEAIVLVPLVFYAAPNAFGRVEYLVLGPGCLVVMLVCASHVGLFALEAGAVTLDAYRWDRALAIALVLAVLVRVVPMLVRRTRSEYLALQLHSGVSVELVYFLAVFMSLEFAVSTLARFSGLDPDVCLAALERCWAGAAVVHPLTLLAAHAAIELWLRQETYSERRGRTETLAVRVESDRRLREKLADLRRRNPA